MWIVSIWFDGWVHDYVIIMASQPQLAKQNFRETGKFKSINEQPQLQTECLSPTLHNMQSERFV